jgi:hypothetical protein
MTALPLTSRPAGPDETVAYDDGRRLRGRVLMAELDGVPLAVVAVDGSSFAADPVARARHAVRVLLMHRDKVISDAGGPA